MKTHGSRLLLIDHRDSFIYNILDWFRTFDYHVDIVSYDSFQESMASGDASFLKPYKAIVLSPGPKSPSDYPASLSLLQNSASSQKVFGICLGFQMMCELFSIPVRSYSHPMHGATSPLIFKSPSMPIVHVPRYHSLRAYPEGKQWDYFLAYTCGDNDEETKIPMIFQYKNFLGFQFHPESFLILGQDFFKNYVTDWMEST